MKGLTIHLPLPHHLRQWLTHALGLPVRFPDGSYENRLLTRILTRPPRSEIPTTSSPMHRHPTTDRFQPVPIIIPDNPIHRPEYYNHLSRRARALLTDAIDTLFRIHLWSECAVYIHSRTGLNRGIDQWCRRQGISIEYREAVRQKFYRMRRTYERDGIILGEKHRKHYHANGQKRTTPPPQAPSP